PAAAPLQIPAKVDHPDIAIVDVFAQPVGLDQRSERHHEPITNPGRGCRDRSGSRGGASCGPFSVTSSSLAGLRAGPATSKGRPFPRRGRYRTCTHVPDIADAPPPMSTNTLRWPTVWPGVANTRTP